VMRMTWINVDYMLNSPIENIYEPMTFMRYLMVSKYNHFNKKSDFHIFEP
jgi:hypothetical protein